MGALTFMMQATVVVGSDVAQRKPRQLAVS